MPTPATYTHGQHRSVLDSYLLRTAETSAGYLLPHLEPGMSVLDIGCGPGAITADLAAAVAPGEVIALVRVGGRSSTRLRSCGPNEE